MLSLEEALGRILAGVTFLGAENVPLTRAADRFIASDIESPVNLPGFDNSAMDGYAVCSADLKTASEANLVELNCIAEIPAGASGSVLVKPGDCVRIFTGSPLPSGADAVVMQEDTRSISNSKTIQVLDTVRPWENVRFAGEDVKKDSVIARHGERIRSGHIALLAACGLGTVAVGRRPRVGLLATGSELVEPGQPLSPGQIFESNRTLLALLVEKSGGEAVVFPIVMDKFEQTCDALAAVFTECDVVITSGGVSVGDHDYVKPALENLGGTVDVWKVAIRPGKPFVYGQLNGKHLFGLPGNPISALVTFRLLVRPALLKMQGAAHMTLPTARGILGEAMINHGNRRHFARVILQGDGRVVSAGLQASHALSSLVSANGLLEIPPETSWDEGREVLVLRADD